MSQITQSDSQHELDDLDRDLDELSVEGQWRLKGGMAAEPKPWAEPHLWPWQRIRRLMLKAGQLRAMEGRLPRRTIRLCTPGLPDKWTSQTIHAGFQLVQPGETASAHRHTGSALRFVVEGTGGYTTVEGEKFDMEPGDLVLTPGWTWHDHGNEGRGPMIWLDGHHAPLTQCLNASFFEKFGADAQPIVRAQGATRRRTGALRPQNVRQVSAGCPYIYKGAEAIALLEDMSLEDWDANGGFVLNYVNPLTGGPTLPTVSCRLHRLPTETRTVAQRTTANIICHVVKGAGRTTAGGKTLEWQHGDVFVIPGWTWHEHISASSSDAVLFVMSDEPVYRALALFRHESRGQSRN